MRSMFPQIREEASGWKVRPPACLRAQRLDGTPSDCVRPSLRRSTGDGIPLTRWMPPGSRPSGCNYSGPQREQCLGCIPHRPPLVPGCGRLVDDPALSHSLRHGWSDGKAPNLWHLPEPHYEHVCRIAVSFGFINSLNFFTWIIILLCFNILL